MTIYYSFKAVYQVICLSNSDIPMSSGTIIRLIKNHLEDFFKFDKNTVLDQKLGIRVLRESHFTALYESKSMEANPISIQLWDQGGYEILVEIRNNIPQKPRLKFLD